MEKVRAFQKEEAPRGFVVIDEVALSTIRDIAHKIFIRERRDASQPALLFHALHEYLTRKGAVTNFEVRL